MKKSTLAAGLKAAAEQRPQVQTLKVEKGKGDKTVSSFRKI
jgi:hypothetical protein